jgi:Raf kinase inhibitor-like YbhB/YbcL family protein
MEKSGIIVKSSSFANGSSIPSKHIFNGFGCSGDNISPQLSWSNIPPETKGFAITAYDPDAPSGSGWWHWSVVNIPTTTLSIPEGVDFGLISPKISQGKTDFGTSGFSGPCPPPNGPHRYIFTVFAMKVDHLPIDGTEMPAYVGFLIHANKISSGEIIGIYETFPS